MDLPAAAIGVPERQKKEVTTAAIADAALAIRTVRIEWARSSRVRPVLTRQRVKREYAPSS